MKKLSRADALKLAASILPKEEIIKALKQEKSVVHIDDIYDRLTSELFSLAKIINAQYELLYSHTSDDNDEVSPDPITDFVSP
ncbi:hypothetical protein E4T80_09775 [Muribacter muris]|uniref:Uncharacterized protein n=1 Tax=Muribacter muris TaxID=67855 RepID=A0A4Y9JUJ6_9PAST|nr:hypothetical protein [Muribacter muris]MBF0785746.1 hypothetical protein [Muribacter muris]MBF0828282.1 hypothetical protein [Muribacter muris]TFV08569.1 hypothetical protein E4T80_09775 [Muribacter muris]